MRALLGTVALVITTLTSWMADSEPARRKDEVKVTQAANPSPSATAPNAAPLAGREEDRQAETTSSVSAETEAARTRDPNLYRGSPQSEPLPLEPTRAIEFTTHEGTWISVDVSPDGNSIVFDMLGDIYTLPTMGGTATQLTPLGLAVARYPRFSPDGKQIAYVSDAGGASQAWVMQRDGSKPHAVTPLASHFGLWGEIVPTPIWMPDSKELIVPKLSGSGVCLVRYPATGGTGVSLSCSDECWIGDLSAPSATASSLYGPCVRHRTGLATVTVSPQRAWSVDKIEALDALGVRVSPDGRWLVYVSANKKDHQHATLWRRDLGAQSLPVDVRLTEVSQSVVYSTFASIGVRFPSFAFTPDSRSVIISSDGKLKRIDIDTGAATEIPFTVHVRKVLGPLTRRKHKLNDDPLAVRQILEPQFSPDAKRLTFGAVGKVWVADRGKPPRRLTDRPLEHPIRESYPVFSPDGRWIAYVTWSDATGGQLWKVSSKGGRSILLTQGSPDSKRAYGVPRWAPDGKRIAVLTGRIEFELVPEFPGATARKRTFSGYGAIGWVNAGGGAVHFLPITESSDYIHNKDLIFGQDGKRLFYWKLLDNRHAGKSEWTLQSIGMDAQDETDVRSHVTLQGRSTQVRGGVRGGPSPDGRWLAIENQRGNILLVPMKASDYHTDQPRTIVVGSYCESRRCQFPVDPDPTIIPVTTAGGLAPVWSADGEWLSWHIAGAIFRAPLKALLANRGSASAETLVVGLSVPRKQTAGSLLLRGARIVTMDGTKVIERGELLIVNRRIRAVGSVGSVFAPKGTAVMDVAGKTIVPGFIGVQDSTAESSPLTPFSDLVLRSGLDGGVTTSWIPGHGSETRLSRSETREVGSIVEKRDVSPGCGVHRSPEDKLDTAADVLLTLQTCAALDPSTMQEIYIPTNRIQRQWSVQAAAKLNIAVSHEGSDYHNRIGELLDGFALLEHHHNGVRFRKDMIELWAGSGTSWNSDGTEAAAENARDLQRAGVIVGVSEENKSCSRYVGARGAVCGMLANHEFAATTSPLEALRYLTINGAQALGLDTDLGSIEAGKIADLVVLDGNPLEDLNNVTKVRYVVQDGFVYEAPSLKQVWPSKLTAPTAHN